MISSLRMILALALHIKGLVVYDLAVLSLTKLPLLVHDSVVLKQISDDAIEKIIELYSSCGKQVIIALDKQDSYSEKTSRLLGESAVLRLVSSASVAKVCRRS